MVAAVLNLQLLVDRLAASSRNGLEAFVVDRAGRLVLTSNLARYSIGQFMGDLPHGQGAHIRASGEVYAGDWDQGRLLA